MTTHVARMTMQRDLTRSEDLRVQAESCRQLALLAQTERNRLSGFGSPRNGQNWPSTLTDKK
jgi:hypothetical protein